MSAKIYNESNLASVGFGEPRNNTSGGKFVPLYDTEPKNRVQFQLGQLGDTVDTTTALRVAFSPEANKFDPSKMEMTVELEGGPLSFVKALEGKVVDAAVQNKKAWFKKVEKKSLSDDVVRSQFSSRIKSSSSEEYSSDTMKVRVDPDETEVYIVKVDSDGNTKHGGNVDCTKGSLDAVKRGSLVIPVIRTRGGVYFQASTFGITFEATSILVIGAPRGKKRGISALNLGGASMTVNEQSDGGEDA